MRLFRVLSCPGIRSRIADLANNATCLTRNKCALTELTFMKCANTSGLSDRADFTTD
jgi:hypothetical protein